MAVNHGVGALKVNGITLWGDPVAQTDWGAVSASTARDTKIALHSVSCTSFISHCGFGVVVVTPRVPNSGQLADLLQERVLHDVCSSPSHHTLLPCVEFRQQI